LNNQAYILVEKSEAENLQKEQKVLFHDAEKCSGCTLCMIICAYSHFTVINYDRASIKIHNDPEARGKFLAIYCSHCDHPICEAACPRKAIKKDPTTGIVKINIMMCIGCKTCNFMCPISVPWFHEQQRVSIKCDLCKGDPKCVKFCPTGAVQFLGREQIRQKYGLPKSEVKMI
jgi:Fe-S-cluster-containing dehydrogenase component